MYKQCLLASAAILLLAAEPQDSRDITKKELAKLAGRWLVTSSEIAGEKHVAYGDKQIWHFAGDRFTSYANLKKVEVMRFEIQPDEEPKWLDLIPIPGEENDHKDRQLIRRKCLYLLKNDELRIAFMAAPEEEKKRELEWAKKRPKSFDTKRSDVVVFIARRDASQSADNSRVPVIRKWTDETGKKTTEAELISVENGKVRLRRVDGKEFSVSLEKLSEADQEFVRAHRPESADGD
jgi:uncharacterized protein (TIGR03067 family)